MAIDPALRAMMTEDIVVEPYVGQNQHNEALYGAAVPYKARIQWETRAVESTRIGSEATFGRVIITGARLYVADAPVIGLRDRLTMPGGVQPKIIEAHRRVDDEGLAHHTEVLT